MTWDQILSLLGAAGILAAYAMQHHQRWQNHRFAYDCLNIFGSSALLAVALVNQQSGFIVLQAAWLLISLRSLQKHVSQR